METKELIITIVTVIFASTGFWSVVSKLIDRRSTNKNAERRALLGLLHDRIYELGNYYISQGSISTADYDNFLCLYEPYHELGGNGTGTRIKREVDGLHMN